MLHLKHVVRTVLNGVCNGVAVCGPEYQCLQDEQIKSPLKNFTLQRLCATLWHLTGIVLH